MTHTIVIYHKSDFDGIFCREIARKFLGETGVKYIGWEYGEPTPSVAPDHNLYILDLSVDQLMTHPLLTWIDHHKTAIDTYIHPIKGYRIDGVAACRLTWQWFINQEHKQENDDASLWLPLPTKEDYINRTVYEPLAVNLAGEYDIWDKRNPDADLFQHGLRSQKLSKLDWEFLLTKQFQHSDGVCDAGTILVRKLLSQGKAIHYAKTQENESVIKSNGFTIKFEGLTFLCCNAAKYNSHLFSAGILPEHDGLLGFTMRSDRSWSISLYGVPGKPDIDLSTIAKKYGGGGHKQACGFKTKDLFFLN